MSISTPPCLRLKKQIKLGLIISALATLNLAGCTTSYKDKDPRFTHSINQQQKLDYWQRRYMENKNDSANVIGFAKVLAKTKQEQRALSILETAHNANPKNQQLSSEYGRMALMVGDNKLASSLLNNGNKANKADWKLLSAKGVLEARAGKHKKAIKYFEQALAHNPRKSSILNNLGLAYAAIGKYEKAEKYLNLALKDPSHLKQVIQNLATVYAMQGKMKQAKAIAIRPIPKKYRKVSSKKTARKTPIALNNYNSKANNKKIR